MTGTQPTKEFIRNLPKEDQDAVAMAALSRLKTRSRLERLAEGSVWTKLGWILPVGVSVLILGMGAELSGYLPIIIVFLLLLIQGETAYVHSRIDAIYRLVKDDKSSLPAGIDQSEQGAADL